MAISQSDLKTTTKLVRGQTLINDHCSFDWFEQRGTRHVAVLLEHCPSCLVALQERAEADSHALVLTVLPWARRIHA